MEIWLALAATTVLAGAFWQTVLDVRRQLGAMSFLRAHNAIVREELERIRREVPPWRFLRRRRERRVMNRALSSALSPDEAALTREYERHSWGWSLVVVGTLIGTVGAWVQVFAGA